MIIVLGAPRSGTTSCARALELLDLSVLQYCPLTRTENSLQIQSVLESGQTDYDAIVSSHFSVDLVRQWVCQFSNAIFIHCTRNESDRQSSLNRLSYSDELSAGELSLGTILLQQTGQYFELNCDWPVEWKWRAIQQALDLCDRDMSNVPYPHSNTSMRPEMNRASA